MTKSKEFRNLGWLRAASYIPIFLRMIIHIGTTRRNSVTTQFTTLAPTSETGNNRFVI